MAAAIRPMRLAALTRSRCSIFQTAYNPTSARTGAKYLRARLRGPSMVKYYTPEANIAQIMRQWPELEMINFAEEGRLQDVEDKKKRGKGAPKKAKEKGKLRLLWQICTINTSSQATVAEPAGGDNDTLLCFLVSLEALVIPCSKLIHHCACPNSISAQHAPSMPAGSFAEPL